MLAALYEQVNSPDSGPFLSPSAVEMVSSTFPGVVALPVSKRHPWQMEVVNLVDVVVKEALENLQEAETKLFDDIEAQRAVQHGILLRGYAPRD